MSLLRKVLCAFGSLLLVTSAALADPIYASLPPLPPGTTIGDMGYQTSGVTDGVAWSAGWLSLRQANVGAWWIGFSAPVTTYTARLESFVKGLNPSEFTVTFPNKLSVSAGLLSVMLVNDGLTVQLSETTSGTTTLAIIDPYGPLTPLKFTSLSSTSAADAPELRHSWHLQQCRFCDGMFR